MHAKDLIKLLENFEKNFSERGLKVHNIDCHSHSIYITFWKEDPVELYPYAFEWDTIDGTHNWIVPNVDSTIEETYGVGIFG